MRTLLSVLLVLAVALSGCLGGEEDPAQPTPTPPDDGGTSDPGAEDPGDQDQERGLRAIPLTPGRSFTYTTSGVYNTGEELTIVVAERTDAGYLLAGAEPADLVEEVMWDRPWQGEVDEELNPVDLDGEPGHLFDFPLRDGKTWTWGDDTVTARLASVPGPNGSMAGFHMTKGEGGNRTTWTYVPQVGYLTSYEGLRDNTTYLKLEITSVDRSDGWTWYQPHAQGSTDSIPVSISVSSEDDAVVVSAGGWGGGQAQVLPPATGPSPATYQFADEQRWTYDIFEAAEGSWSFSAQSPPDGLGFITGASVAWTGPGAP